MLKVAFGCKRINLNLNLIFTFFVYFDHLVHFFLTHLYSFESGLPKLTFENKYIRQIDLGKLLSFGYKS